MVWKPFQTGWAKIDQFLPILIPKTYLFSIPVFGIELNTGIPVLGFGIGSFTAMQIFPSNQFRVKFFFFSETLLSRNFSEKNGGNKIP